jgi:hypothetical protein
VLALATFAAVRSANRAARVAEQALMIGTRPLLVNSRLDDPAQKVFFVEGKVARVDGGRGTAEVENGVVYLTISLRNAGRGVAVIHGWHFDSGRGPQGGARPDPDGFRHQQRDILIAPGDIGFWQAAFREPDDPQYDQAVDAVKTSEVLLIDVLYGDNEGGQRAITRMTLQRSSEDHPWLASAVRHWNVDRPDPR